MHLPRALVGWRLVAPGRAEDGPLGSEGREAAEDPHCSSCCSPVTRQSGPSRLARVGWCGGEGRASTPVLGSRGGPTREIPAAVPLPRLCFPQRSPSPGGGNASEPRVDTSSSSSAAVAAAGHTAVPVAASHLGPAVSSTRKRSRDCEVVPTPACGGKSTAS